MAITKKSLVKNSSAKSPARNANTKGRASASKLANTKQSASKVVAALSAATTMATTMKTTMMMK